MLIPIVLAASFSAVRLGAPECPRNLPAPSRVSKEPCRACGDYRHFRMPIAHEGVKFWYWADFTKTHRAKDIGAPIGTPVVYEPDIFCYAIAKTEVVYAADVAAKKPLPVDPAVVLKHTTKSRAVFFSFYAHLSKVLVKTGDILVSGATIGEVGDIGAIRFFKTIRGVVKAGEKIPHLHFGITTKGEKGEVLVEDGRHFIDPRRILRRRIPPTRR